MEQRTFPLLPESEQKKLYEALHYLSVPELQECCRILSLAEPGKKGELITRIMLYIQAGSVTKGKEIPAASRSKNYPQQPLRKDALMLHGSYKNDEQTRALFTSLIGPHFHFTAFGIDWLNERWQQGKPPTYQEFADYWVKEMEKRKQKQPKPKKEWAYLNFLQQASKEYPEATQEELIEKWKKLQNEKAAYALETIKRLA